MKEDVNWIKSFDIRDKKLYLTENEAEINEEKAGGFNRCRDEC